MKKTSITFNDDYMLDGAKEIAREQAETLAKYICGLIEKDIKEKKNYYLVVYYDNGKTHKETDFYTQNDLWESIIAYEKIFEKGEKLPCNNAKVIGFEAYGAGRLLHKSGDCKIC